MNFFWALVGDSLMFAALAWFAGYGATGPATGVRLGAANKFRLFAEVFAITMALLWLFISLDQLLGWVAQPPWPGKPPIHRMLAIGAVLSVGFFYTRRRANKLHEPRPEHGVSTTVIRHPESDNDSDGDGGSDNSGQRPS